MNPRPMRRKKPRKLKLPDRPIPDRYRRAVELYLSPAYKGKAAALRAVGFSEATAMHHAHRVFRDPRVRRLLALYRWESERRFMEEMKRRRGWM